MSVIHLEDTGLINVIFRNRMKLDSYSFNAGAAQAVLQTTFPPVIICDPGGGAIDLLLPAEASSEGLVFLIFNNADAAETISVKEDSDTTVIASVAQSKAALLYCDGTTWRDLLGA